MKQIIALAVALALALSLAACGGKADKPAETGTPKPEQTQPIPPTAAAEPSALQTEQAEELSDEERILREAVFEYCVYLYNGVENAFYGDDTLLKEVTEEEYTFLDVGFYCFGEENSARAFAALMAKHVDEFASAMDPEVGGFFDAGPDGIAYPGGWDAFYREFQALKVDALASAAVVDTVQEAFQALEVPASDRVIYQENGVEFSFTGCTADVERITFQFHISNQNPDNKKVSVFFSSASANGLSVGDSSLLSFNKGVGGLPVGEEADISCVVDIHSFEAILKMLGLTVETAPIQTLAFDYQIQIGSDAELEEKHAELKTSAYQGGSLEAAWGDKIGSAAVAGNTLDIYAKQGGFGIVALAVNRGEGACTGSIGTSVNGKNADGLNEGGSGRSAAAGTRLVVYPGNAGILFYTEKTDEEIRREYEIGGSETMEITVSYDGTSVVVYSK